MAKKNLDISKSKRIDTLRSILKNNDWLTKEQISLKLSAALGCAEKDVRRSTYRDLNELIENYEIEVRYFYRDGAEIEDFNADEHKNYFCKWIHRDRLDGHGSTKGVDGVHIHVSRLLSEDYSFFKIDGISKLSTQGYNIIFEANNSIWCLSVDKRAKPFKVFIKRSSDLKDYEAFDNLQEIEGKRAILLEIPNKIISSRSSNRIGHMLIEFDNKVSCKDLGSKNGSFAGEIQSENDLNIILEDLKSTTTRTEVAAFHDLHINFKEIKRVPQSLSGIASVIRFGASYNIVLCLQ